MVSYITSLSKEHILTIPPSSNEADIRILESAGVPRPPPREKKKPTIRLVAIAIRATVRMKMGAAKWAESRKIQERIEAKIEQQKMQLLQQQKADAAVSNTSAGTKRKVTSGGHSGPRSAYV